MLNVGKHNEIEKKHSINPLNETQTVISKRPKQNYLSTP